jgi:hypothetical protein
VVRSKYHGGGGLPYATKCFTEKRVFVTSNVGARVWELWRAKTLVSRDGQHYAYYTYD